MRTWKIPCTWKMKGFYYVDASTLKIAIQKIIEGDMPYDNFPTNQETVENSFELEKISEIKKLNHG